MIRCGTNLQAISSAKNYSVINDSAISLITDKEEWVIDFIQSQSLILHLWCIYTVRSCRLQSDWLFTLMCICTFVQKQVEVSSTYYRP